MSNEEIAMTIHGIAQCLSALSADPLSCEDALIFLANALKNIGDELQKDV